MIDTDGDGSVTVDEVTAFFNKFNKRSVDRKCVAVCNWRSLLLIRVASYSHGCSTEEIQAMVTEVDTSGDNEIDILEFKAAMGNNANIQKASKTALKRRDWAKHFQQAVVEVAQAAGVQQAKRKKVISAAKAPSKEGAKASQHPTAVSRATSYETDIVTQKVLSEAGAQKAGGGRDGVDTEPAHRDKRQKKEGGQQAPPKPLRQNSNTRTKLDGGGGGVVIMRTEHMKGEQNPVMEPVPDLPDDGDGFGSLPGLRTPRGEASGSLPGPVFEAFLNDIAGITGDETFSNLLGDLHGNADEISAVAVPDFLAPGGPPEDGGCEIEDFLWKWK
jgi:hypothetical protein